MSFRAALRFILVLASLTTSTQLLADSDFAVTKNGPSNAALDTDVAYDVSVVNVGPDPADVTLTDTMPAGLTFVSIVQNSGPTFTCTDPGAGNNGPISCSVATLNALESADFTITMHIPAATQPNTTFTNTAVVTTSGLDPNSENDVASASTVAASNSADLGVTKSGPNATPPDTDVTYTITVENAGPFAANTVEFTDTLPGTMTFVSFNQNSGPTFSCTTPAGGSGGTIDCTIDPFANNAVATFTLVGHIPSGASGFFTNTVTVTSANDSNGENDVASTTVTVSSANLSVAKSGPLTATGGQQISYPLSIANGGPDTSINVHLTDVLPSGTTFSSVVQNTGPAFSCTGPPAGFPGTVDCSIPSFASGGNATFTLVLNVNSTFPDGGTLTNTATISAETADPDTSNNSSSTSATVTGVTDVSVTKSGPATLDAGAQISWTITVQNLGANAAASTTLTDTLPAGTTFVSLTQNSGPAFNCNGTTTVTCTNASFAAGSTATFTLVASTASSASGTISNTATVSTTTADTNSGNDTSTANTTLTQHADLSVMKSGPGTAIVGTDIAYTITATNPGPSDASNVTISDTLPAATTFVSMQQNSGPAFNCSGTTTVTCTIATFTAGASATFTLTVHVNSPANLSNTATIASTTPDPNANDNTSTATTIATEHADLSVTKSGPALATVGTDIAYTITAANAGPNDASTVTLNDTIPAATSFVSMQQNSGPAFNCSGTTTVTCTIATFASGATASFTLTVHANSAASDVNTATISSTTTDPNSTNNSSSVTTNASLVDLSLTKSVSNGPYLIGQPVTFTLTVTNNGAVPATGIVVTDPLPGGMSATSTTPPGACTGTTTVTCTAASLAAGASTSFTITANLPPVPGTYTNTATVASATTDATPANNSGSAQVAVVPPAAIPTLSPEVLMLLAALLGAAAVLTLKR